jgi:parvulin-like peptidyl-prolyl isomerase
VVGAAVATLLLASCGGGPSPSTSPTPNATVIARVGDQTITQGQFDIRFQSAMAGAEQGGAPASGAGHDAMVATVRARILQSLITDAVIADEAKALGLAATPKDVADEIAQDQQAAGGADALETQLAEAGGSMDQLRDETVSRLNEQRVEEYFAKGRAAQVEASLAAGGDFRALARQYSDDQQTAPTGGDVGVMDANALDAGDAAFRNAVLALHAGQYTTTPARDSMGFEILEVTAVTPQGPHVLRILVSAAQPYTVQSRPQWFGESVLLQLSTLCQQNRVTVYIDAGSGNQPCVSPSATAAPAASATPARH